MVASHQPPAPQPVPRVTRSNWGLRLVALLLSVLAFLGLWQGAQHASTGTPTSSQYAPPSSGTSGVFAPGGLVPHSGTHVS